MIGADALVLNWGLFEFIFYTILYFLSIIMLFSVFPFLIIQGVVDGNKHGWKNRIKNRLFERETILARVLFSLFSFILGFYFFFIHGTFFLYWDRALAYLFE